MSEHRCWGVDVSARKNESYALGIHFGYKRFIVTAFSLTERGIELLFQPCSTSRKTAKHAFIASVRLIIKILDSCIKFGRKILFSIGREKKSRIVNLAFTIRGMHQKMPVTAIGKLFCMGVRNQFIGRCRINR